MAALIAAIDAVSCNSASLLSLGYIRGGASPVQNLTIGENAIPISSSVGKHSCPPDSTLANGNLESLLREVTG